MSMTKLYVPHRLKHVAYEATAEFQQYLESKSKWEAEWRKDLEAARRTTEHLAAFGF